MQASASDDNLISQGGSSDTDSVTVKFKPSRQKSNDSDLSQQDEGGIFLSIPRVQPKQKAEAINGNVSIQNETEVDPDQPPTKPYQKREYKLKIFVLFLFFLIVIGVILVFSFYHAKVYQLELGRKIRFYENTRELHIDTIYRDNVLIGNLGMNLPKGNLPSECYLEEGKDTELCLRWKYRARMQIYYNLYGEVKCYNISWGSEDPSHIPLDCYSIGDAHWYGGGEMLTQEWPLEKTTIPVSPYLSGVLQGEMFGPVVERYWLTSKGAAIMADYDVPLYISINDTKPNSFCLAANYDDSPFPQFNETFNFLRYRICVGNDVKQVHNFVRNQNTRKKVTELPDSWLFSSPVWSTKFHDKVNQSTVSSFAGEIQRHGFLNGTLELTDFWQNKQGDFEFNTTSYPNATGMIETVKNNGLKVAMWVHPFANVDSKAFLKGVENDWWVKGPDGEVTALMKWANNNVAAVLDTSNNLAVQWFTARLQAFIKEYNIDSLSFGGRELGFLPAMPTFVSPLPDLDHFTTLYNEMVSNFGLPVQMSAASRSYHLPIFLHMYERNSYWNSTGGLKSIIPTALTLSILGYSYIIPGAIGGKTKNGELPEKNLYIRWLQISAFMPVMEFSIGPWEYDDQVMKIAKKFVNIHKQVVSPKIVDFIKNKTNIGEPIVKPLWWLAPRDKEALTTDSEYLLLDTYLVAPVLEPDALSRDIYLPEGVWTDGIHNNIITGPRYIRNYRVNIDQMPYFILNAKND